MSHTRSNEPTPHIGKQGLTLIEVMVAFTVFAVSMISVVAVMVMGRYVGGSARARIQTLPDAVSVMEFLQAQSFNSTALWVDNPNTGSTETVRTYSISLIPIATGEEYDADFDWKFGIFHDADENGALDADPIYTFPRFGGGVRGDETQVIGTYTVSFITRSGVINSGELKRIVLNMNYPSLFQGEENLQLIMEKSRAIH